MAGITERVWDTIAWPRVEPDAAVEPAIDWRDLPTVNVLPSDRAGFDCELFRDYVRAAYPGASYHALSHRMGLSAAAVRFFMIGATQPMLHSYLVLCGLLEVPLGSFLAKGQIETHEPGPVVGPRDP